MACDWLDAHLAEQAKEKKSHQLPYVNRLVLGATQRIGLILYH